MADLNFDATKVAPDAGYGDPLPTGWYKAQIDESEMKPTADGSGSYLKLRFSILEGQYANRKLFEQLNLRNNNQQTVEIAQKQLSAICHAVGVLKLTKSEELHGKPLTIKVGQKPASGGYDAGNKITSYKNVNEKVDMAGGDAGAAAFGAGGGGAPESPWSTGAASEVAAPASPAPQEQPWANAGAADAPAAPPPPEPEAPAAPPPPAAHDPMEAAKADGWIQHPSSPPHMYKGQDVKLHADVAALYPAPAAPAAPETPAAPPAPPAADTSSTVTSPPWATPKA